MKPQFDEKNTTICGVSFDTVEENHAFRQKCDFPYALLSDTTKALATAYGAADDGSASHPKRITVIVSKEGRIARVFDTVKPAEHPQEVLAAI